MIDLDITICMGLWTFIKTNTKIKESDISLLELVFKTYINTFWLFNYKS